MGTSLLSLGEQLFFVDIIPWGPLFYPVGVIPWDTILVIPCGEQSLHPRDIKNHPRDSTHGIPLLYPLGDVYPVNAIPWVLAAIPIPWVISRGSYSYILGTTCYPVGVIPWELVLYLGYYLLSRG